MKKLAVFFPGIGYTVDKPLLHYSRRLASNAGYDIRLLPYTGFPKKVIGDTRLIEECCRIALEQSRDMLSDVDFSSYDEILFVGKSIGTIIAAHLASESPQKDRIRLVLYTPLPATFDFAFGDAIAFTGSADQWVGDPEIVPQACTEKEIPCHIVPDANHSLETGNVQTDLQNIQTIMIITEQFIND